MIQRNIIKREEVYGACGITLEMLKDDPECTVFHALRREGIRYLIEVTEFSHAQLCRLESIGETKAGEIERTLAKHGLLLKGADPAIIEHVKAEDAERQQVREQVQEAIDQQQVTSEELIYQAVDGLFAAAKSMLQDGGHIMHAAAKILSRSDGDGRRSRSYYVANLKRYAFSASRSRSAEIGRLIAPIVVLDDAEKAEKKGRGKKPAPRGRTAIAERDREQPNVIRPKRFAEAR